MWEPVQYFTCILLGLGWERRAMLLRYNLHRSLTIDDLSKITSTLERFRCGTIESHDRNLARAEDPNNSLCSQPAHLALIREYRSDEWTGRNRWVWLHAGHRNPMSHR